MDKQAEEKSQGKLNAGRGVVKERNSRSDTKSTAEENKDNNDRPDDRARKAGY